MRFSVTDPQKNNDQEIIDSVSETLNRASSLPEVENSRSFLSTLISCAPYIIMGLGAYFIWTKISAMFKTQPGSEGKEAEQNPFN